MKLPILPTLQVLITLQTQQKVQRIALKSPKKKNLEKPSLAHLLAVLGPGKRIRMKTKKKKRKKRLKSFQFNSDFQNSIIKVTWK